MTRRKLSQLSAGFGKAFWFMHPWPGWIAASQVPRNEIEEAEPLKCRFWQSVLVYASTAGLDCRVAGSSQ
jgi:hypothetical protein